MQTKFAGAAASILKFSEYSLAKTGGQFFPEAVDIGKWRGKERERGREGKGGVRRERGERNRGRKRGT